MDGIVYLASVLIPWILKGVLYHYGFRWRHVVATIQTTIIVAAASMIVGGLMPVPLPHFLLVLLGAGLALYLCKKFTDGKLYPDLVMIVGGVELLSYILVNELIMPVFF